MSEEPKSGTPRWILIATGVVGLVAAILVAAGKYYEFHKARIETAEAEARQQGNKSPGDAKTDPPLTGKNSSDQRPLEPKPTSLSLLPVKTEEEARKYWAFPLVGEDWQLTNGGLKFPGSRQRISTVVMVEGNCRIEFACGSAGWKGPAISVFGETLVLPPAIGGWPIQYSGAVVRKGTSLNLSVEVSQPGLKRLEEKQFDVTIKAANADIPSPITFLWPDDMGMTLIAVKVTGKMTIPEK